MTTLLHRLALGIAVVAFLVVAASSTLAGAAPMSVVTRGVIAFVVFGVFGLVVLPGVLRRVVTDLARHEQEKRRKEQEETHQDEKQPKEEPSISESE